MSAPSDTLSFVVILVILSLTCEPCVLQNVPETDPDIDKWPAKDFYSYDVINALGDVISLGKYRGLVTLVVNVASECGFTDGHYNGLIRMKNVLSTSNKFEVLAFPCNQFGEQEPASNDAIQDFVRSVYHVNFPVFAKIPVLGDEVPDAWQYLITESGNVPNWNFWKYLVDERGRVARSWGPWTSIEDIFHDVKEAVDLIGYEKPEYFQHGGEL